MSRSPASPTPISKTRPSTYALAALGLALSALAAAVVDARLARPTDPGMAKQVATWGMTDLALFTEARYTRHPSQADRHAPFQDHPGALEHFPTGALIAPPAHLRTP